jgi:hypothetical protein
MRKLLIALALTSLATFSLAQQGVPANSTDRNVAVVRTLNTAQVTYAAKHNRFGTLKELVDSGVFKESAQTLQLNLNDPEHFLANADVKILSDGKGYQIMLKPHEKCAPTMFSSESGVIYVGKALGCGGGQIAQR